MKNFLYALLLLAFFLSFGCTSTSSFSGKDVTLKDATCVKENCHALICGSGKFSPPTPASAECSVSCLSSSSSCVQTANTGSGGLVGGTCSIKPLNEETLQLLTKTQNLRIWNFMLGGGIDFHDFELSSYYFPLSDWQSLSSKEFNEEISKPVNQRRQDRFTNYMDFGNPTIVALFKGSGNLKTKEVGPGETYYDIQGNIIPTGANIPYLKFDTGFKLRIFNVKSSSVFLAQFDYPSYAMGLSHIYENHVLDVSDPNHLAYKNPSKAPYECLTSDQCLSKKCSTMHYARPVCLKKESIGGTEQLVEKNCGCFWWFDTSSNQEKVVCALANPSQPPAWNYVISDFGILKTTVLRGTSGWRIDYPGVDAFLCSFGFYYSWPDACFPSAFSFDTLFSSTGFSLTQSNVQESQCSDLYTTIRNYIIPTKQPLRSCATLDVQKTFTPLSSWSTTGTCTITIKGTWECEKDESGRPLFKTYGWCEPEGKKFTLAPQYVYLWEGGTQTGSENAWGPHAQFSRDTAKSLLQEEIIPLFIFAGTQNDADVLSYSSLRSFQNSRFADDLAALGPVILTTDAHFRRARGVFIDVREGRSIDSFISKTRDFVRYYKNKCPRCQIALFIYGDDIERDSSGNIIRDANGFARFRVLDKVFEKKDIQELVTYVSRTLVLNDYTKNPYPGAPPCVMAKAQQACFDFDDTLFEKITARQIEYGRELLKKYHKPQILFFYGGQPDVVITSSNQVTAKVTSCRGGGYCTQDMCSRGYCPKTNFQFACNWDKRIHLFENSFFVSPPYGQEVVKAELINALNIDDEAAVFLNGYLIGIYDDFECGHAFGDSTFNIDVLDIIKRGENTLSIQTYDSGGTRYSGSTTLVYSYGYSRGWNASSIGSFFHFFLTKNIRELTDSGYVGVVFVPLRDISLIGKPDIHLISEYHVPRLYETNLLIDNDTDTANNFKPKAVFSSAYALSTQLYLPVDRTLRHLSGERAVEMYTKEYVRNRCDCVQYPPGVGALVVQDPTSNACRDGTACDPDSASNPTPDSSASSRCIKNCVRDRPTTPFTVGGSMVSLPAVSCRHCNQLGSIPIVCVRQEGEEVTDFFRVSTSSLSDSYKEVIASLPTGNLPVCCLTEQASLSSSEVRKYTYSKSSVSLSTRELAVYPADGDITKDCGKMRREDLERMVTFGTIRCKDESIAQNINFGYVLTPHITCDPFWTCDTSNTPGRYCDVYIDILEQNGNARGPEGSVVVIQGGGSILAKTFVEGGVARTRLFIPKTISQITASLYYPYKPSPSIPSQRCDETVQTGCAIGNPPLSAAKTLPPGPPSPPPC